MKFEHWWASKHPAAIDEAGFALLREAWAEAATAEREACALACEAEHVGKNVRDPCDNASDEAYNQALEHAATAIRQRVTQAL